MAKRTVNIKEARDVNTGMLLPQPRGFRLRGLPQYTDGETSDYYVRLGFLPVRCDGEAHQNAFIDNCMWGVVAVPEKA